MLHPSYTELINTINSDVEDGEAPVVNSRFSIVMAASKRARQIIDKNQHLEGPDQDHKPLSTAVSELWSGDVTILAESEEEEEQVVAAEAASDALIEETAEITE